MFKTSSIGALLLLVSLGGLTGCGTAASPIAAPATAVQADQALDAQRAYRIEDTLGIGPVYGQKLRTLGVTNTDKLLAATSTRYKRHALADKADIPYKLVLGWAQKVNLMRIDGIGVRQSNMLSAVGVNTVKELSTRDPENLQERLGIANSVGDRFVGGTPSVATVTKWVAAAKKLEGRLDDDN